MGIGLVAGLLGSTCLGAEGLTKLPRQLRTNGRHTLQATTDLSAGIGNYTVSIVDGDETVALGTVVDRNGVVVTKASELGWQTALRLDEKTLHPTSVEVDELNDLAILQFDYEFDAEANWISDHAVQRGQILVAPANTRQSVKMGIVSANSRTIEREGGALGVILGRRGFDVGPVRVSELVEEAAAERAGIKVGDIIRSVDGEAVQVNAELIAAIGAHFPGESVRLAVTRGDDSFELDVTLGFRSTYFGLRDRNQQLSGETSTRLNGFASVLQHDIPVAVDAMGGPVVDLAGRVVGINIARADRVCTFALPVALVKEILAQHLPGEGAERAD